MWRLLELVRCLQQVGRGLGGKFMLWFQSLCQICSTPNYNVQQIIYNT